MKNFEHYIKNKRVFAEARETEGDSEQLPAAEINRKKRWFSTNYRSQRTV